MNASGVLVYVHCNPITSFDAWGLDVWFVNRGFQERQQGTEPRAISDPVSHAFIVVTDKKGNLVHTYSWGNTEDRDGNGEWSYDDPGSDVPAAKEALRRQANRKVTSRGGGPIYAKKVGDSSYDQDVAQAYAELEDSATSRHKNSARGGKWNAIQSYFGKGENCWDEREKLWNRAKHIHNQRIDREEREKKEAEKEAEAAKKEAERTEFKDENGHIDYSRDKSEGNDTHEPDNEE